MPGHRRGPRHRPGRVLRRADAGRHPQLPDPGVRTRAGRAVQGARGLSARRAHRDHHARPAHLRGMVARRRYGHAPVARPLRRGPGRGRAQRAGHGTASAGRGAGRAATHRRRRAAGRGTVRGRRTIPRPCPVDADGGPVRGRGLRAQPSERPGLDGRLPELAAQARSRPHRHRRPRRPAGEARRRALGRGSRAALGRRAPRDGISAGDLPPAIPQGLHLRRRGGDRSLPREARDQPRLRLAAAEGATGLDPRLRHRRSWCDQSGAGWRGRVHPPVGLPSRTWPEVAARHRSQPHGRRRRRQPVVALGAGMGCALTLRACLRHRLGAARRQS